MFLLIAALVPNKAIDADASPTTFDPDADTVTGPGYFVTGDDFAASVEEPQPAADPTDALVETDGTDRDGTDDEDERFGAFVAPAKQAFWPLYAHVADDGAMHAAGVIGGFSAPTGEALITLIRHRDPGEVIPFYL